MTDFRIVSKPDYIAFDCPHCELSQKIRWGEVDVPENWCDSWGEVECPDCRKSVELGDWEYD